MWVPTNPWHLWKEGRYTLEIFFLFCICHCYIPHPQEQLQLLVQRIFSVNVAFWLGEWIKDAGTHLRRSHVFKNHIFKGKHYLQSHLHLLFRLAEKWVETKSRDMNIRDPFNRLRLSIRWKSSFAFEELTECLCSLSGLFSHSLRIVINELHIFYTKVE